MNLTTTSIESSAFEGIRFILTRNSGVIMMHSKDLRRWSGYKLFYGSILFDDYEDLGFPLPDIILINIRNNVGFYSGYK